MDIYWLITRGKPSGILIHPFESENNILTDTGFQPASVFKKSLINKIPGINPRIFFRGFFIYI
jgi:hypothetical protein